MTTDRPSIEAVIFWLGQKINEKEWWLRDHATKRPEHEVQHKRSDLDMLRHLQDYFAAVKEKREKAA